MERVKRAALVFHADSRSLCWHRVSIGVGIQLMDDCFCIKKEKTERKKEVFDTNCLACFQLSSYKSNSSSGFPGFSFSCLSFLDICTAVHLSFVMTHMPPLSSGILHSWGFPGQLLQSFEEVDA